MNSIVTTAKVFMSGNSQAIRLPKEFRVSGNEVYITKNRNKIVITEKSKRELFKKALDDVFGCCSDLDFGRDKIMDEPREVNL
jgi:virulence-associated protein VagC